MGGLIVNRQVVFESVTSTVLEDSKENTRNDRASLEDMNRHSRSIAFADLLVDECRCEDSECDNQADHSATAPRIRYTTPGESEEEAGKRWKEEQGANEV